MDENLKERTEKEINMMKSVFSGLKIKEKSKLEEDFFSMASNYFKDSEFFLRKNDYIRAFESIVISWSYIDAGIKSGFFSVGDNLKEYFTS